MPSAPSRALAPALMLVLPVLAPVPGPPTLEPGDAVEREISGGEVQSFLMDAQAGQHLLITVEQHGINVALSGQDPSWQPLGITDTATEREGSETWLLPAEAAGSYRIEVRPAAAWAPRGRYRIGLEELPSVNAEDRLRIEAERIMTEAGLLFSLKTKESRPEALAHYSDALAHWRTLGRKREEARTLFRLAVLHQNQGEAQPMLDRLQEALPLFVSLGDKAREADVLTYIGVAQDGMSRYQEAIASSERSLEIRRARGDRWGEAMTSQNICLARLHLAEWREAISCYKRVLPMLEEVGEPDAEALNGLGGAYSNLEEPRKAREYYDRAREAQRALGNSLGEAKILNNIGVLLRDQDALGEALVYYGQALDVIRSAGDRFWEGLILTNLGNAYLLVGEPGRARDYLDQALPIRRELKDPRGKVHTLCNLGFAQQQLGEVPSALVSYAEALEIAREAQNRSGEAMSLNLLAEGHLRAGDLAQALKLFVQAAALQQDLENRGGLAFALQKIGEVEARLGHQDKALASLREAVDLYRALADRSGQASSLASLAAAEREMGRLDEALTHANAAIGFVESVRATVGEPSLRASFLASQRLAFELAIALRMDLERKQPGKGHMEAALALSERARARSLFDLLHEAGMQMDPELREQKKTLAFRLSANARKQRGATTDEQRADVRRELAGLLAEADRLENEIRRSSPRYAALSQPLDAPGIRGLLDADTLLLEYSLGEEKSFLWAVSLERVDGFELPGRAKVEAAARRSYEEVRKTGGTGAEAHRTLSRLLLGPVAGRIRGRRLVIVADGALQYIPFAMLPDPGDPGAPLVAGHEIVSLPSASVLDVQRRLLAGRPPAEKGVAILADPVFASWDSRLRKPAGTSPPAAPPPAGGMPRIQRLPRTGHEAEAIAALLSPDQVFKGLGLQASRTTALSGTLAKYRMVHFATHGWINAETPRSSGLTLSMVDEQGRPQEGLLSLSDVYNLELKADLVILSGCDTALGREIRGEGLVGLTQGFFYAGSERVMASLWPVQDHATAELMKRFYGAMLQEKLPPAAALRSAQLAIRSDKNWQDPYFWAPFVLQGDWR